MPDKLKTQSRIFVKISEKYIKNKCVENYGQLVKLNFRALARYGKQIKKKYYVSIKRFVKRGTFFSNIFPIFIEFYQSTIDYDKGTSLLTNLEII
ncbi:hypothetical protein BpHYR1_030128 [Brachionus plicatilis]|uniref:Uncharacterized protein n=1 Tax=Brachionus plicatilis TaxID=10195 RepID=A0A3M7RMK0_BRAPC|nr:hypothetical protein BpHYR1_030128 [Brachionus plicatilis]